MSSIQLNFVSLSLFPNHAAPFRHPSCPKYLRWALSSSLFSGHRTHFSPDDGWSYALHFTGFYRRTDSVCHHTLIRTVEAEIQFLHHSTTLSNIQQEYGECEWRRKLFSSAQAQRQEEKKLLTSQLIDFRELNCTFRSSTRSQTVLALPFHLLQHKFVPEMHYFLRLSAIFTCWWFQYFFASHSHGTKILQRDGDDHLHSTTLAYGQTASKVLQRSEASTVCSFWDFHEGQKGKERWEKCCARE